MGPLEGIKILDLSKFVCGPYCVMLLADMGAEVVKVESLEGDDSRNVGTNFSIGGETSLFLALNRNKQSLCIDLRRDEGSRIFFELVRNADVVVESFRPGTTKDLGIDYETVKSANHDIIYCSLSAFGDSGPYRERPGLDVVIQAMSGIMGISGEPEGRPMRPGFPAVDASSGIMAAYGIVLALFQREKTGEGMKIDLSLLDNAISIQTSIISLYFLRNANPPRFGNASPFTLAQDFKTGDGKYICISIGNNRFLHKFYKALGVQELIANPRFDSIGKILDNMEELVEICQNRFLEKKGEEWERLMVEGGIPCSLVNTYEEVFSDKQVRHNRIVLELDHPTAQKIRLVRSPLKLDAKIMTGREFPPPLLGEHTRKILFEIGYDNKMIDALERRSVIKCSKNTDHTERRQ